jgi:hypothetical protein
MTRRKWSVRIAAVLFLLLLAANLYVFFDREWESSFFPTNYATLYYPLDVPTIRTWGIVERNRLQLDLSCTAAASGWQVYTDGGNPQSAAGMKPTFRIDTTFSELHTYRLEPVPPGACPPVEITIRFYSQEFYASQGMDHPDVYVVRSNVPCGEFEQYTLADWTDDYAYVGEEGLAETARLLREEAGINEGDSSFDRMEKVTRFLRIKLKNARGVPKNDERWMNPWVLYNEMANGTGKGWCTQHAQLYVYWANRAGIPTRFVFGARTQDNTITYTGHSWAESYIREQSRWAFVDLTHAQVYITNKNGQVLNTVELFHLNQQNAFDSTTARIYVDWEWQSRVGLTTSDSVLSIPFTQCNMEVRSEFSPHNIFKFRRPPNVEDVREIYTGFVRDRTFLLGNLERYLFKPQLAYSLYPTEGTRTYCIRRVLLYGMMASLLLWIVLAVRNRKTRVSTPPR